MGSWQIYGMIRWIFQADAINKKPYVIVLLYLNAAKKSIISLKSIYVGTLFKCIFKEHLCRLLFKYNSSHIIYLICIYILKNKIQLFLEIMVIILLLRCSMRTNLYQIVLSKGWYKFQTSLIFFFLFFHIILYYQSNKLFISFFFISLKVSTPTWYKDVQELFFFLKFKWPMLILIKKLKK